MNLPNMTGLTAQPLLGGGDRPGDGLRAGKRSGSHAGHHLRGGPGTLTAASIPHHGLRRRPRPIAWAPVGNNVLTRVARSGVDEQPPFLNRSPVGGVVERLTRRRCAKQAHGHPILASSIQHVSEHGRPMATSSNRCGVPMHHRVMTSPARASSTPETGTSPSTSIY